MSQPPRLEDTPQRAPDPVGCVGGLLLIVFLAVVLRGALAQPTTGLAAEERFVAVAATSTVQPPASATPRPSATPQPATPRPTQPPTATPPPPLPTATLLPLPFGPPEPTVPPDYAPDNLPTPAPTWAPPLPTPQSGGAYAARMPILMYHYVSDPPADADIYRTDLSVSPAELRRQLTYLRDNGYTTITLYDLARALANRQALPPKPVILTFDDGYRDNYTNAFPLLREFGMRGVFFLVTDFIDSGNPNYMTWEMAAEMARAGMSMEIHTRTHPNLTELKPEDVIYQVQGAQQIIAQRTGVTPRFVAYPGGFFNEAIVGQMRDLDLWGGVTTRFGYSHLYRKRFELERIRMRYTTTLPVFAGLLNEATGP